MNFALRALAICCIVVAHGFAFSLGNPPSVGLGLAYGASIVGLGVAAVLLWRKTVD